MPAALTNIRRSPVGARFHITAVVTESGSYSAGGTPITAKAFGLLHIDQAFVSPPDTPGYHVTWDQVAGTTVKFKTYDEDNTSGIEAEVTGTVAHVYSVLVIGI